MTEPGLSTWLINLDCDEGRWVAMSQALQAFPNVMLKRVPAVFGKQLPDAACLLLSDSASWVARKGELGCFLSHVATWEAIKNAATEWCLVLEDDVTPRSLDRILKADGLAEYDLVFVNDRMSPGDRDKPVDTHVTCLPIRCALNVLNYTGKGVGSDGYLIRPAAAARLLDATRQDLYFGNIDWRLLRYSVSKELLEEFRHTRVCPIVSGHHNPTRPPGWGLLRGGCMSSPFVTYKLGIKSRIAGDMA